MSDMSLVIVPKSDQINFEDFAVIGTLDITVREVSVKPGTEQPVSINFGDKKVFRPCKTMSKLICHVWKSNDSKSFIGKSMRLYGDPKVRFGPMQVGGIRISHMSDITEPVTVALMETRGKKAIFTVKPLTIEKTAPKADKPPPLQMDPEALSAWADDYEQVIDTATEHAAFRGDLNNITASPEYQAFKVHDPDRAAALATKASAKVKALRDGGKG